MDKRYQVFISSTFEDLQEERKEVMQALLELDCIPAGMELFPASNDDQWTLIKRVIDDSDYYLLILAGRYGSTNDEGMGYTEMEYRYAVEKNKPIISFLHKNPGAIQSSKSEQSLDGKEKLKLFRELAQKKMNKFWTNPDDLGSVVSRSMIRLTKDYPATGWVRADEIVDENSMKEILLLQKENSELKEKLQSLNTTAPVGTDKLSQGEDEIDISYVYHYINTQDKEYIGEDAYMFTWNEIFRIIAPYLIDECDESTLSKVLKNYLKDKYYDAIVLIKQQEKIKKISNSYIKPENFQVIKVQLKALGLIQKSLKNRSVKDTFNYWKLTPYGDYVMTQLVAIKNKK
ncbi:DUF4062 domain-containing protein [Anaeromicropila herbilytica]|uniref:DUF4062 domain-containing protein n=1 Tax=Anaeromicropila herbilytica TaxID=2785025 RepID=A0A7R7ENX9_9FIRM|nr:DUF4062 domain-containing protein [Anaeromicropila herbilytica]BCN32086.1 hypothetical protein bsdtb5_33810 [Anaeromicropila herbilytica]